MARVKGTTKKAGSVRTQKTAQDVHAVIEKPHGGKTPKQIGHRTTREDQDLRGIPGEGKVRAVGPSEIRESGEVGRDSSVRVVGGGNFEDSLARMGGELSNPATRQEGSVRSVGPVSRDYAKLLENAMPRTQTQQARFAPKRGRKLDKGVKLLKSGVGHGSRPWSRYAGSPGSQPLGSGKRAFTSNSLLINGRRRVFGPEAFDPRRDLKKPKSIVLPGGTRIYE